MSRSLLPSERPRTPDHRTAAAFRSVAPRVPATWPRRVELAGRATAIGAAVVLTAGVAEMPSLWAVAAAAGWLAAVQSAFARSSGALRPLGAGAPAAAGAAIGGLIAIMLAFALAEPRHDVLAITACAASIWLLVLGWETVFRRRIAPTRGVLVVGSSSVAAELVVEIERDVRPRYSTLGVVVPDEAAGALVGDLAVGTLDELPAIVAELRPDIVVLALQRGRLEALDSLLESAHHEFRVLEAPQFFEHAFGRLPVRDLPRWWFLGVVHLYRQPYSAASKRAFDLVVAGVALALTAPLFPLIALLVLASPGPILIRQSRVGEHGRPFVLHKFRTMHADAEPDGAAVWAQERDPRITRIGRFLRASRLDELPQLWNVMTGTMSIVGPRPERPEFIHTLEARIPYWSRRHLVKPGLTGWAQIRSGYSSDPDGALLKLSHDLWYLRHRSLLVDLAICARTILVLLGGRVYMRETETASAAKILELNVPHETDASYRPHHHQQQPASAET